MRILVTGGAGFIGSHLILNWVENHPSDEILNVDKLSYASDLSYLKNVEGNRHYRLVQIDLFERVKVRETIRSFQPEAVIHLAAESHVDNSIRDPEAFIHSNIVGTFNLLEECRQYWSEQGTLSQSRFLHVSTDEVYGSLGESGFFTEESPYAPNSPYAASKAASDHLVRSYQVTYGMNVIVTHCSNNFGPHQHAEKLIPTVIRTAFRGEPIPVYGQGKNKRDWLYVKDHCAAIDRAFHRGRKGAIYNIGADNEWENLELVRMLCETMNLILGKGPQGDYKNLITFVEDRPGHDYRYAIDSRMMRQELDWKPAGNFADQLRETVCWYVERLK